MRGVTSAAARHRAFLSYPPEQESKSKQTDEYRKWWLISMTSEKKNASELAKLL